MTSDVDTEPRRERPGIAHALSSGLDHLINAMAVVAGVLLVGLTVATFVAVLSRNFLGQPLAWSLELTEFALLYITFLTAPWVLRRGGHVRIDLLVGRLGGRARQVLQVFAMLIGIAVCGVIAYYGTRVTYNAYERGLEMINVLRVPRYLVLWVIPFGSVVMVLQFVRMLFDPEGADLGSAMQEGDAG